MRALWERSSRGKTPSRPYQSFVACAIYTRQSVARPGEEDFSSREAQRLACLQFLASRLPDQELRWEGTTSTFTIVLDDDWLIHGQEHRAEDEDEPRILATDKDGRTS